MSGQKGSILDFTAQIVVAYLANNQVDASAVPLVIRSVYGKLSSVGDPEPEAAITLQPAVPVKKSVFPDFIVCLEDGQKLKMLKRHLETSYGLTPNQYRMKWRLPHDYPMVAPNYATKRSTLAREIGLGRRASVETAGPELDRSKEPEITVMKTRRARRSKCPFGNTSLVYAPEQ